MSDSNKQRKITIIYRYMCIKNPSVDGVNLNGFYRIFYTYVRLQSASTEQINMEVDKIQCRIISDLKKTYR
jgi:hypothetical protein